MNLHEELFKVVTEGCRECEFEEAEGELYRHCAKCQEKITQLSYQLYATPGFEAGFRAPGGHHPSLSLAEQEMLVLTMEECSELIKACSKIWRHGKRGAHRDGTPNLRALEEETADVQACLGILAKNGFLEVERINRLAQHKLDLLKDPNERRVYHIRAELLP